MGPREDTGATVPTSAIARVSTLGGGAARETGDALTTAQLEGELAEESGADDERERNRFVVSEFLGASFGFDGVAMSREAATPLTVLAPAITGGFSQRYTGPEEAYGIQSSKDWFVYLRAAKKEARPLVAREILVAPRPPSHGFPSKHCRSRTRPRERPTMKRLRSRRAARARIEERAPWGRMATV